MSNVNPFGIFASGISCSVNTGIDAVRNFSDEKCRRVYRACAAVLPAEEVAAVRSTYNPAQTMNLCGCTAAQAWVSRMLSSVKSEMTQKTVIHGADDNQIINDERPAATTLLQILAA